MQESFILTFMRSMMGAWFTPIWDYVMLHSREAFAILSIWVSIYLIGRYQVKKIKQQTVRFSIEQTKDILKKRPKITSKGLYKEIFPKWEQEVSNWAKFVPHRLDFFPVRVTPDNVLEKFDFDAEWLAEALKINGVNLPEFKKD